MKQNLIKIGLLLLIVLYAALPDPVPGPIDDIIVLLAGGIATYKIGRRKNGGEK